MAVQRIFLTGATGFVGSWLLPRLATGPGVEVVCPTRGAEPTAAPMGARFFQADLERPDTYAAELEGASCVVHAAARTGKARASDFERANTVATGELVDRARAAGVARFLFVSTIAVRYPDKRAYPYARSKETAEEIVRASDLAYTIVRPTVILGGRSPLADSLGKLARAPVLPVFGDGRARVQPVHVRDVAEYLAALVHAGRFVRETIDLGGPDVLTLEDLLRRMRVAARGSEGPVLHLPVRLPIAVLSKVEEPILGLLPFTAGQLSAFVNDGLCAEEPPEVDGVRPRTGVDEMVADWVGGLA
jgi:NADH dehydrogenase